MRQQEEPTTKDGGHRLDVEADLTVQPGASEDDLPDDVQMSRAFERLTQFAGWTDTTAPARLLSDDGAPSPELLSYCKGNRLSLDWIFCGDPKGYIMSAWRNAEAERQEADVANTAPPATAWRDWLSDLHLELMQLKGLTEGAVLLQDEADGRVNDQARRRALNALVPLLGVLGRETQRLADHVEAREEEVCGHGR